MVYSSGAGTGATECLLICSSAGGYKKTLHIQLTAATPLTCMLVPGLTLKTWLILVSGKFWSFPTLRMTSPRKLALFEGFGWTAKEAGGRRERGS